MFWDANWGPAAWCWLVFNNVVASSWKTSFGGRHVTRNDETSAITKHKGNCFCYLPPEIGQYIRLSRSESSVSCKSCWDQLKWEIVPLHFDHIKYFLDSRDGFPWIKPLFFSSCRCARCLEELDERTIEVTNAGASVGALGWITASPIWPSAHLSTYIAFPQRDWKDPESTFLINFHADSRTSLTPQTRRARSWH